MTKNNKRVLACTLFISLLILVLAFTPALADDDPGYVIENFHVDVVVNQAREHRITETIEVNFTDKRQGLFRTIPIQGDAETYLIEDVFVVGETFNIEGDQSNLILRIGDRGVYHKGPKTYTIEYTLKYYQDYYNDADYIYLNLVGSNWDVDIKNFSAAITYPSNAVFDRLVLTSGPYYSTGNEKEIRSARQGNRITFTSSKTLHPGESVTANIRLNEGAFSKAPAFLFPFTINQADVNMTLTKEKKLLGHAKIEVTQSQRQYNQYGAGPYRLTNGTGLPGDEFTLISDSGGLVFSSSHEDISSGLYIYLTEPGTYTLEYSFRSFLPMNDGQGDAFFSFLKKPSSTLELPLFPLGEGPVEKMNLTLHSQVLLSDLNLLAGRTGDDFHSDYTITTNPEDQSLTLSLQTDKTLFPGENITLYTQADPSLFTRPFSAQVFIPIVLGLIGLALTYLVLQTKGRDEKLVPVVSFYPPDHLSSPEAGYALNKKITPANLITILYNWANLGYIKMSEAGEEDLENKGKKKKQEDLVITKVTDIHPNRPQYEITLFNQLFARGKDGVVTSKNLENKFYKDVQHAIAGLIKRLSKGEKALYKNNSGYVFLAFVFGLLPLVLLFLISQRLNLQMESALLGLVISSVIYIFVFITWGAAQRPSAFIVCLIALGFNGFALPYWVGSLGLIPLWACLITLLLSSAIAFMAPFLSQRTAYGQQVIQELMGFKTFIEAAEKQRLEALLEEDPAYFYNILPYAQVFGLTKIWTDKFENILLQAPDWYESRDPWDTAFTMVYLSRMQNAMTRLEHSAVSVPAPTPSQGSFSGSGGGGFSGGGFSGGGGGGGGGGSW